MYNYASDMYKHSYTLFIKYIYIKTVQLPQRIDFFPIEARKYYVL